MKNKYIFLLLCMILLSACNNEEIEEDLAPPVRNDKIEIFEDDSINHEEYNKEDISDINKNDNGVIDLTEMNSNMVYAIVNDMQLEPENYIGMTIIMNGEFVMYESSETGILHKACLIYDALLCCAQGIDFVLLEEYDYPKEKEQITIKGTFDLYEKDGITYIRVVDAEII